MQPVSGEVGTHTQAVRCPGPKLTSWPHWLSICHKLQDPVQTPSPERWIVEFQGIHGFGLSINPLTQGLHSWQCRIQCGLDWSRVPDNTVRHPPPLVSSLVYRHPAPTPPHPYPLGLRLWIQTNMKPNAFHFVPSNSVILEENKYLSHWHE